MTSKVKHRWCYQPSISSLTVLFQNSVIGSLSRSDYQINHYLHSSTSFNKAKNQRQNLIFKSSDCQTYLSGQFIERVFSKVDLNGSKNIIRFEYLLEIYPLSSISGLPRSFHRPCYPVSCTV